MWQDCLIIISISLTSACLAEGISWLLIYRTEDYKKLKNTIEGLQQKVDKRKDKVTPLNRQKSNKKKVAIIEDQLQHKNREMSMVKMKSMFFVMIILFGVFGLLNNLFDGQVVAKLPFEPISLIRGLTHRNLPGEDWTDCSVIFLYALCSFSIRQNLQKALGFQPPGGQQSIFGQMPQQYQ